MKPAETITIPIEKYYRLRDAAWRLNALENAGVDNWDGYDYAVELLEGTEDDH